MAAQVVAGSWTFLVRDSTYQTLLLAATVHDSPDRGAAALDGLLAAEVHDGTDRRAAGVDDLIQERVRAGLRGLWGILKL